MGWRLVDVAKEWIGASYFIGASYAMTIGRKNKPVTYAVIATIGTAVLIATSPAALVVAALTVARGKR